MTDELATSSGALTDQRDRVIEARWRITYKYTTMSISGTIDADFPG